MLKKLKELDLATSINRGIERECLRVSLEGTIAQTPHNQSLGSALMHPYITTDYSESLLEFVTPVFQDSQKLLDFLRDLHIFTLQNIDHDILWCNSMPCHLQKDIPIPIANYGTSNLGKMKRIYRKGLLHRYGSPMQTISGIHFNFSLNDSFFEKLHKQERSSLSLQEYKSKKYMDAIRNIHRHSWVIPYFLGSSPFICSSFFKTTGGHHILKNFDNKGTLSIDGGTSLRLSSFGYNSTQQSKFYISRNSIQEYCQNMQKILTQTCENWKKLTGEQQLNNNLLQLENEHYSCVRPKRTILTGESPNHALRKRGIEYIEIRSVDINNFSPIGIELNQILFLDIFILHCLFTNSEHYGEAEAQKYRNNREITVLSGRQPNTTLYLSGGDIKLTEWGHKLFDSFLEIAEFIDESHYNAILDFQKSLLNSSLLPSSKQEQALRQSGQGFFEKTLEQSTIMSQSLKSQTLSSQSHKHLKETAAKSLQQQKNLETQDEFSFDDFLSHYNKRNQLLE